MQDWLFRGYVCQITQACVALVNNASIKALHYYETEGGLSPVNYMFPACCTQYLDVSVCNSK